MVLIGIQIRVSFLGVWDNSSSIREIDEIDSGTSVSVIPFHVRIGGKGVEMQIRQVLTHVPFR